ncbi:hypothetical protein AAFF_G00333180 [Aldrovandia affinis]|uniref:Uncharacterized protein n=1 Tax=Aldrovandia affinis TaxID=143900 RepID=A0AAD7SNQ9_9TELE|nr:hypothetical protein AAFF_G00333180 [Aldrovandia affinis]
MNMAISASANNNSDPETSPDGGGATRGRLGSPDTGGGAFIAARHAAVIAANCHSLSAFVNRDRYVNSGRVGHPHRASGQGLHRHP